MTHTKWVWWCKYINIDEIMVPRGAFSPSDHQLGIRDKPRWETSPVLKMIRFGHFNMDLLSTCALSSSLSLSTGEVAMGALQARADTRRTSSSRFILPSWSNNVNMIWNLKDDRVAGSAGARAWVRRRGAARRFSIGHHRSKTHLIH